MEHPEGGIQMKWCDPFEMLICGNKLKNSKTDEKR